MGKDRTRRGNPRYIAQEAYERTTSTIRSYPDDSRELTVRMFYIYNGSAPPPDGMPRGTQTSDPVAGKYAKLTSPRVMELKRRVEAFELAWNNLGSEEKKVIGERFWEQLPYRKMTCHYSEREAKRIVSEFILALAYNLGEID